MSNNEEITAVTRNQEYYRLKKVVDSPGAIFELDASARAVYIGPDSDISEVQLTYFEPINPTQLESAVVSVNGPFVGRIDSLPLTPVSSTGQPARILVSPVDLVDDAYVPPASVAQRRFNVPAVLDLMVALRSLPDIPSVRADRTLRYANVPYQLGPYAPPTDGSTDLIVPIYGRRLISATVIGNGITVDFSLINLIPGDVSVPRRLGSFRIGGTMPVVQIARTVVIRASDAGRISIGFDLPGLQTTESIESDAVSFDPTTDYPQARGTADLLLINIKDATGAALALTRFADVYIKIADRET